MSNIIKKGLKNPSMALCYIIAKSHLFDNMDDERYLKMIWRIKFGRKLNLEDPQTFTEKLQWLKLFDRKPEYTSIVDKYEVKKIVADRIGVEYVIPTLGIWDSVEEIEWDRLPKKFVLKTTNGSDSSGVVICKDKDTLNKEDAKEKLAKSLRTNVYKSLREWPYKNVKGRILAEKYLTDEGEESKNHHEHEEQLKDYKFYCFNGVPKFMLIASNRFSSHNFNYYDMSFNKLSFLQSVVGAAADVDFEKPDKFEEMKEIAAKLSQGFAHIRVDLYSSGNRVYFGELTFYDSSGYDDFCCEEWNLKCGQWIELPRKEIIE